MEWDFDFTISNISRHSAELIVRTITAIVEAAGGQIGGGFVEIKDEAPTVLEEGGDDEKDA